MRRGLWLGILLLANTAYAQGWQVGTGIGFRHAGAIDLASQAGVEGYGHRSDTSPGQLSWQLCIGFDLVPEVEIGADASIAVGGLALDGVEERYFGQTDTIGGTLTAEATGAVRWVPRLGPDLRLVTGLAAGMQRMSAASGVGGAMIDSFTAGPEVGLRWRVVEAGAFDGELQFRLDGRWHEPVWMRVGSAGDPVFESDSPRDAFWSVGTSVSWLFYFR